MEADLREKALARRHILKQEQLSHATKPLPPLATGDLVRVQDQAANKQPGKWTKTGKIVEVQKFDSYLVKIDGSNTVTKRNRRFLRKIVPFINAEDQPETGSKVSPPPAFLTPSSSNVNPSSTRTTRPGLTTSPPCPTPPARTTTPTATPAANPPHTRPSKPTSRQPVKERWIVTKKFPTRVPTIPKNIDEKTRDDAVPNSDDADVTKRDDEVPKYGDKVPEYDDEVPLSSDENHVDVQADTTAATSTNTVSSTPIPFRIIPKPPGTRHDYEEMTRNAARARAEVSSSRL